MNHSCGDDERDHMPRAERAGTCTVHGHSRAEQDPAANPSECRFPRAEQDRRTDESRRSEKAFQDWSTAAPAERPLAQARPVVASALFGVLRDHAVSNSRFADMVGVDEKSVRQWLKAEKPIPGSLIVAMPIDMATDLTQRLLDANAGGKVSTRRAVAALKSFFVRVGPLSERDKAEVFKVISDIMRVVTGGP